MHATMRIKRGIEWLRGKRPKAPPSATSTVPADVKTEFQIGHEFFHVNPAEMDFTRNWPRMCPILHLSIEYDFDLPSKRKFLWKCYYFWYFSIANNFAEMAASVLESNTLRTPPRALRAEIALLAAIALYFLLFFFHFRVIYVGMRFRMRWLQWIYLFETALFGLAAAYFIFESLMVLIIVSLPTEPTAEVLHPLTPVYPLYLRTFALIFHFGGLLYCIFLVVNTYSWITLSDMQELEILNRERALEDERANSNLVTRMFKRAEPAPVTDIPSLVRPESGHACVYTHHEDLLVPGHMIISPTFLHFSTEYTVFSHGLGFTSFVKDVDLVEREDRILQLQLFPSKMLTFRFRSNEAAQHALEEMGEVWADWLRPISNPASTTPSSCFSSAKCKKAATPEAISSLVRQKKRSRKAKSAPETLPEPVVDVMSPLAVKRTIQELLASTQVFTSHEFLDLAMKIEMEPYAEDDLIFGLGAPITHMFCAPDGTLRLETQDFRDLRNITPEAPVGLQSFVLWLIEHCHATRLTPNANLPEDLSVESRMTKTEIAVHEVLRSQLNCENVWVANENVHVYKISFSSLLDLANLNSSMGTKVFIWLCKMLADRILLESSRVYQAAKTARKQANTLALVPVTRLLDRSSISHSSRLSLARQQAHSHGIARMFGLPPGEAVVFETRCFGAVLANSAGAPILSARGKVGTVYVFLHHVGFHAHKPRRVRERYLVALERVVALQADNTWGGIVLTTRTHKRIMLWGFACGRRMILDFLVGLWKCPELAEAKMCSKHPESHRNAKDGPKWLTPSTENRKGGVAATLKSLEPAAVGILDDLDTVLTEPQSSKQSIPHAVEGTTSKTQPNERSVELQEPRIHNLNPPVDLQSQSRSQFRPLRPPAQSQFPISTSPKVPAPAPASLGSPTEPRDTPTQSWTKPAVTLTIARAASKLLPLATSTATQSLTQSPPEPPFPLSMTDSQIDSLFEGAVCIGFQRNQVVAMHINMDDDDDDNDVVDVDDDVNKDAITRWRAQSQARVGLYRVVSGTVRQQRSFMRRCASAVTARHCTGDIFGIEAFAMGQSLDAEVVVETDKAVIQFLPLVVILDRACRDFSSARLLFSTLLCLLCRHPSAWLNSGLDEAFLF
eukprot:c22980_g1_i1.p1 GENE.c22980_g1_i1~~c22980_g1_i1.p1  ORF type:complete len:1215 (+),score=206.89 c22980_g1_i1:258-3647(+)